MRFAVWHRMLASLLAIIFAVGAGEPAALHSCPMHEGSSAGGAGHHERTTAGHHHDSTHLQHGSPAKTPEHRHCSCVGECSVGSAATALTPVAPSLGAARVRTVEVSVPSLLVGASTAASYFLPYANGPPRA